MPRALLIAVLLISAFSRPLYACMGPSFEDHHYPSCTVPAPTADETVYLINASGQAELSSHHLGRPDRITKIVRVHIEDSATTNYLMLSTSRQTIWVFTGDTDSVSKAVVLGATSIGPNGAGVIGLDKSVVHFTKPDLSLLEPVLRTSCTRISQSCVASQWFSDRVDDRVTFYPERPQSSFPLNYSVSAMSNPRIEALRNPDKDPSAIAILKPDVPNALIAINPTDVVAQTPLTPYELLPSYAGLEALVASGALIPATDPSAQRRIADYRETWSARYRSKFDPNFKIEPKIDYVITRKLALPPELRPTAFLLGSGVPAPDMNGNRPSSSCYYEEDSAALPVTGTAIRSPKCRLTLINRTVRRDQQADFRAAAAYDRLEAGEQACQLNPFPDKTHVAALHLSEGKSRRYRDDPIRKINIEVTRRGPTALYLSMIGGRVHWNVAGEQVVGIYINGAPGNLVTLNGNAYTPDLIKTVDDPCRVYGPSWQSQLGPAVKHLDAIFQTYKGQGLDQLITHKEQGAMWKNPSRPAPTYVIK